MSSVKPKLPPAPKKRKFAVTEDEFIQYQHFLMNPTKCHCPDGIIQNDRKMYEIEKKWDQLAEHYSTPSKTLIFS